jgi:hypothetical protein
MSAPTTCCSKCGRASTGPGDMWESVSNGNTWFECRMNEAECRNVQMRRKADAETAASVDFLATYGFSKDELTTEGQPQCRDYHRRYVHPPTGRVFKQPFDQPDKWTEC